MANPPVRSGAELDWEMTRKAALDIIKQCDDAGFTPPEALDVHMMRIARVCVAMNAITDALKLRKLP
jgi:hypothetical protein